MVAFFPQVNIGFSLLMPGGFIGGHGTAATFGASFEELCGWDEALTIGQTFATIGILSGVILGALCILAGFVTGGDTQRIKDIFFASYDIENKINALRSAMGIMALN